MHAFFIHRKLGRRKSRISKCADRYGQIVFQPLRLIIDGSPASGTKMKAYMRALIRHPHIHRRCPGQDNLRTQKSGLLTKHAAGTSLASQAMTNRNPHRLASDCRSELTTTTGSKTLSHQYPSNANNESTLHQMLRRVSLRHLNYIDCRQAEKQFKKPKHLDSKWR